MKRGHGIVENASADPELDLAEKSGVRTTAVLGSTRLRFERCSPCCVLTVEAPARDDLMPELYRRLLAARVQVVRVHAQVLGDRTLHELDVLEPDGTSLDDAHWQAVQAAIAEYLGDRVAPIGPELRFTRARSLLRALRQAAE